MQRICCFSHSGKGEVEVMEESSHRGAGKATHTLFFGEWTSMNVCSRQTAEGCHLLLCSRGYEVMHRVLWWGGWAQGATESTLELSWYEGQRRYYGESVTRTEDYCSRKVWGTQKTIQWKINSLVLLLMEQFVFFYVWMFGMEILWFYQKYVLLEQKVVPAVKLVQHFTNVLSPWAHQKHRVQFQRSKIPAVQ